MSRRTIFTAVAAICLAVSVTWVTAGALSGGEEGEGGANVRSDKEGFIVFQHISRDPATNGHIAVTNAAGTRPRRLTNLQCERVYFAAAHGLCLIPNNSVLGWGYDAKIFNSTFHVLRTVSLPGINTRARISPNGRLGAATGFVSGHSYADDSFSTATFILDLERGKKIANLEDFTIEHDGDPIRARDRNFWGVTFARDSDRFYATMATGGKTFLIEASVTSRTGRTISSNVECPSLSPDGTRIAFKRSDNGAWKLYVLDLETLTERPTAEMRAVDDQPEWFDEDDILYGLNGSIWVVPADGSGRPTMFLENALSPAAVATGN